MKNVLLLKPACVMSSEKTRLHHHWGAMVELGCTCVFVSSSPLYQYTHDLCFI